MDAHIIVSGLSVAMLGFDLLFCVLSVYLSWAAHMPMTILMITTTDIMSTDRLFTRGAFCNFSKRSKNVIWRF